MAASVPLALLPSVLASFLASPKAGARGLSQSQASVPPTAQEVLLLTISKECPGTRSLGSVWGTGLRWGQLPCLLG